MRRIFLLLFTAILAVPALAQGGQPQFLETFKPAERVHDFGTIQEKDGIVKTQFKFINTGSRPVVISDVNTSCGCLAPSYTKRAVRKGEEATVDVSFNPDHKSGNFVKQVVVLLNDGNQYARVWIKANIVPMVHPVTEDHPYYFGQGLYMSQEVLPFPDLDRGQSHSYELRLANDTDKPMTIEFLREPNNTVLKLPATVKLKPRERTSIRVSYRYPRRHNITRYINLVPVVNGKRCRPLRVKWNAGDNKFRLL